MHQLILIHPMLALLLTPVAAVVAVLVGFSLLTAGGSRLALAGSLHGWWPRVSVPSPLGGRPWPDAPLDAEALSREGICVDFERSGPDEAERVHRLRSRRTDL